MGQSIQEWTKQNLWKTAFKKFYLLLLISLLTFFFIGIIQHLKMVQIFLGQKTN